MGGPEFQAWAGSTYGRVPISRPGTGTSKAPAAAYQDAIASANALGWQVTKEWPEQTRFEATDTSAWFRFVDDMTVRVRAVDAGAKVDVRSRSRDGKSDLGVNAKRIRAFLAALNGS